MPAPSQGALSGRRLLLLPRYTDLGPSSRLRMSQFIPAFEAAGATVEVSPLAGDAYLHEFFATGRRSKAESLRGYLRRAATLLRSRPDLVWLEKENFPYFPGWAERLLALPGAPYVVDYDDAAFHIYDRHRSALVRRVFERRLDPLLRRSALVTAGNTYLADYAREHGARDVMLVPTVLDPRRYPQAPARDRPPFRVGWIGTPKNTQYLELVVPALNALGRERAVELVTIGSRPVPGLSVPQVSHAWSEAEEAALLGTIDVGVMPLINSPYERGKCGYKLIQYMAAGRPVVASPVGVNTAMVIPEVGRLATTADEWLAALRLYADDPALRARTGRAARRLVEQRYSVEAVAPSLVARFADLCAR